MSTCPNNRWLCYCWFAVFTSLYGVPFLTTMARSLTFGVCGTSARRSLHRNCWSPTWCWRPVLLMVLCYTAECTTSLCGGCPSWLRGSGLHWVVLWYVRILPWQCWSHVVSMGPRWSLVDGVFCGEWHACCKLPSLDLLGSSIWLSMSIARCHICWGWILSFPLVLPAMVLA